MRFSSQLWTAPVLLALLTLATPARANDLDDALALEEAGQLMAALEALQQLRRSGGQSRADLAVIYLHSAMLQQASGDGAAARQSMLALLAVDPEPELPDTAPPDVAELLDEARERWGDRRLEAEASPPAPSPAGEPAGVTVIVNNDVAELVARVALVGSDGGADVAGGACPAGGGELEVTVPADALEGADGTLELEVRLLDAEGNTLWQGAEVTLAVAPDGSPETVPPVEPTSPRGPMWIAGWTLLAAGVLAASAGGALVGLDETRTGDEQNTVRGLEAEILNTDVGGWVFLGIGGATLAAGIVLLVLSTRNRRARQPVALTAGGLTVEL